MLRFYRPGLVALVALVSACASAEENLIGSDAPPAAGAGGASAGASGAAGGGGLAGSGGSGQSGAGQGGSLAAGAAGQGGAAGGGGDAGAGCGAEVCGNLSDDNCDGKIDDGCVCTPGATSACFGAPEVFRGKGVCRDGITQCTGPAEFGSWTECVGDVLPGVEVCDPEQIDEDCDGAANEGCECEEGSAPVPCGSDVGLCQKGLQACEGGKLGPCVGSVDPSPEQCDGLDNDCDGEADEALSRPCGESKGACSPGFQACQQGAWGACEGDTPPSDEICDGVDNDCDGEIDDGVLTTCGVSTGACKIGSQACVDGALAACSGAIGPSDEACNNVDDDCDGQIDEGLTEPCGSSIGACKPGVRACAKGAWGACAGEVGPVEEACDGIDNDCDGTTDEGCSCLVGSPPVACGSTVGACQAGEQSCIAGQLGPCVGAVPPSGEVCNNVDDDCDGQVDEGVTESCGSSIGTCKPGVKTCAAGAWGACVGEVGPVEEVCDGLDNDCDGQVDEGLTRSCGSDVGRCVSGLETCAAGAWGVCVGAVGPLPEVCDGAIDEDCDGAIDDGCVCAVGSKQPCGVSVGACQQGEQTCDAAGQWGPCVGAVAPAAELCDGLDNDCDGQLDEGCACISGEARLCGSNQGQCSFGVEICSAAGQWGPCAGGVGPGAELCDGLDNDCDGQIDEGCGCVNGQTQPCGMDVGQCKPGKQTCTLAGQWGPCAGGVGPANEVCNGLDDDCDGKADEEGVCPVFPPAVSCPGDAATTVGTTVTLGGAGSDPDGGAVTFSWSVSGRPQGSTAQPAPVNAASTKFTPDLAGAYELTFCVTDDEGLTTCCKTKVNATSNCSQPPTAPTVQGCGTSWDRRPIIEFTPLPVGQVYEVLQDGVAAPLATLALPGQNYYRPPSPLGAGGPPPGVAVGLSVRACKADNKTCCATSNTVQPLLVEACSTLTSPTTQNVLFSEYLINGSGGACPSASCQAGEAIEITNLSHCPVSLEGHHFGYQNPNGGTFRWMNFTPADVIPPRGVYVAIRNRAASACPLPFFGPDDPALFGLKISALDMQGDSLDSGWFNNGGGGQGTLRIATGSWQSITGGATIAKVSPYAGSSQACTSVGFNAIDACGDVVGVPTAQLSPNQLGRLWRPCDRVVNPVPAGCQLKYPELPYAPSQPPLASGPRAAVSLRAGGPLDHRRHQRISHHRPVGRSR